MGALLLRSRHLLMAVALAGAGFAQLSTNLMSGIFLMCAGGVCIAYYLKEDPKIMEKLVTDIVNNIKK